MVESDITDTSGHSVINALMEASIRFYGNMDQPGRLPGGGDAKEKDRCEAPGDCLLQGSFLFGPDWQVLGAQGQPGMGWHQP